MQLVRPMIDQTRLKVIRDIYERDPAESLNLLALRRQQSDIVKSRQTRIEELRVTSASVAELRIELGKLEKALPEEEAKLEDFTSRYEAIAAALKTSSALLRNCETFLGVDR